MEQPTMSGRDRINLNERLWKMLRKKVSNTGFYRTEKEFRRAVMNLFEHISDYKERLESILTLNFDWLIPKPFRCDYNKNVDGFYQTEEEYLYNFRHRIQKGWDFFNNPLDVTHGGIRGAYIDYHDPNLPQLLNNLSLQSMQYDYLGWIDGNFWIAGVGNGIYYNKKRVRGAQ